MTIDLPGINPNLPNFLHNFVPMFKSVIYCVFSKAFLAKVMPELEVLMSICVRCNVIFITKIVLKYLDRTVSVLNQNHTIQGNLLSEARNFDHLPIMIIRNK